MDDSPRFRAEAWARRALPSIIDAWQRGGAAYERHLKRQGLARDPLADLMALAARRVLPLSVGLRRQLGDEGLSDVCRALALLPVADRRVLFELGLDERKDAHREHLAAALWRLAGQTKAARRSRDAPLGF